MSMSFSTSERFRLDKSCAPPVGSYDLMKEAEVKNIAIDKQPRFNSTKEIFGCGELDIMSSGSASSFSGSVPTSPGRRVSSAKTLRPGKTCLKAADLAKQRQLEADVRQLLQARIESDTVIRKKEDEISKLEAKLTRANKEKSTATARAATLEKENLTLHRSNETLKKEAASLVNNSDHKKQMHYEINHLKQELRKREYEVDELKKQVERLKLSMVDSRTQRSAVQGESEVWYESEADERVVEPVRTPRRETNAHHAKVDAEVPDTRPPTESGDTNQFERFETAI